MGSRNVGLVVCVIGVLSGPLRVAAQPALVREERAYPTGDRNTSVILLERLTPAEVRPGEEFTYELRLTNLTRGPVDNVQLVEQSPSTFTAKAVTPQPSGSMPDAQAGVGNRSPLAESKSSR
jgi:hypothetical protein